MRTISPNTRRLINQLYEPASFWERLSHSGKAAGTLTEIGNSAEPVSIIDILPFVLADRKEVAIAAAAAVHKLTEATSPRDLLGLDRLSRERSPYVGNYRLDWYRLLPKDLDRLQTFGEASTALLGIAGFHHSGYVREEAVKRLNRITTGIEIPFLLIRLDDWVSSVRDAAQKAINSRLDPAYCRSFITNLALIARLEAAAKVHSEPIIKRIKELQQSAECRSGLTEALSSNDRFIRRASFRLAINSKGRNLSEVLRQALNDSDTVIRLWAAQGVSAAFEGAALDQMLTLMKRDRFMPCAVRPYAFVSNAALTKGAATYVQHCLICTLRYAKKLDIIYRGLIRWMLPCSIARVCQPQTSVICLLRSAASEKLALPRMVIYSFPMHHTMLRKYVELRSEP